MASSTFDEKKAVPPSASSFRAALSNAPIKPVKNAAYLLQLMSKHRLLVKVIGSEFRHWQFHVPQWNDPRYVRPVPRGREGMNRAIVFDGIKKAVIVREISAQRGLPKYLNDPIAYAKKTAFTLMAPSGRMVLFSQDGVGVIFDINECKIKDKVFSMNATTDSGFWISGAMGFQELSEGRGNYRLYTTVDQIRADQNAKEQKGELIYHNEILAKVRQKSILGLFALRDEHNSRLDVFHKKCYVQSIFNDLTLDLPLLVITPDAFPKEYTLAEQIADIKSALQDPNSTTCIRFVNWLPFECLLAPSSPYSEPLRKIDVTVRAGSSRFVAAWDLHEKIKAKKYDDAALMLLDAKNHFVEMVYNAIDAMGLATTKDEGRALLSSQLGRLLLQKAPGIQLARFVQFYQNESDRVLQDSMKSFLNDASEKVLGHLAFELVKSKRLDVALWLFQQGKKIDVDLIVNDEFLIHQVFLARPINLQLIQAILAVSTKRLEGMLPGTNNSAFLALDGFCDIAKQIIRQFGRHFSPDLGNWLAYSLIEIGELDFLTEVTSGLLKVDTQHSHLFKSNENKNCLLHVAVIKKHKQLISNLVALGARFDQKNKKEETPLDVAMEDRLFLQWIIQNHGNQLCSKTKEQHNCVALGLLLLKLILKHDLGLASFLLRRWSNIKFSADDKGDMPIHLLAKYPRDFKGENSSQELVLSTTRGLLEANADLEAKNKDNKTPTQLAIEADNHEQLHLFVALRPLSIAKGDLTALGLYFFKKRNYNDLELLANARKDIDDLLKQNLMLEILMDDPLEIKWILLLLHMGFRLDFKDVINCFKKLKPADFNALFEAWIKSLPSEDLPHQLASILSHIYKNPFVAANVNQAVADVKSTSVNSTQDSAALERIVKRQKAYTHPVTVFGALIRYVKQGGADEKTLARFYEEDKANAFTRVQFDAKTQPVNALEVATKLAVKNMTVIEFFIARDLNSFEIKQLALLAVLLMNHNNFRLCRKVLKREGVFKILDDTNKNKLLYHLCTDQKFMGEAISFMGEGATALAEVDDGKRPARSTLSKAKEERNYRLVDTILFYQGMKMKQDEFLETIKFLVESDVKCFSHISNLNVTNEERGVQRARVISVTQQAIASAKTKEEIKGIIDCLDDGDRRRWGFFSKRTPLVSAAEWNGRRVIGAWTRLVGEANTKLHSLGAESLTDPKKLTQ